MHKLVNVVTEIEDHIDEYEFFKFHVLYTEIIDKLKPIYGDKAHGKLIDYLEFKESWEEEKVKFNNSKEYENFVDKNFPEHLQEIQKDSKKLLAKLFAPRFWDKG